MNIFSILKEVELGEYDISNAPGLVGEICHDINQQAVRSQPRLAVLSALHIVSSVAAPLSKSPSGLKLNLITVGVAPTGSGKDVGQQYMKKALSVMKVKVNGRIPSAQSIGRTLIDNSGVAIYLVDEAHGLFDAMVNERAPQYQREIGSEILSAYTDRHKVFSIVDTKGIKEEAEKEASSIKKDARDEGITDNSPELGNRLAAVTRKIEMVENGIRDPFFSLAAYSTPGKLEKIFCEENIESGLAGRVIFVRAPDLRATSTFGVKRNLEVASQISFAMSKIRMANGISVDWISADAFEYARRIHGAFETLINDHQIGSVATRGYELVERIASIIAIGDGGKIKREHMSWAFQFVTESIVDTWSSTKANESQGDDGWHARWSELLDKAVRQLIGSTAQKPVYMSSICQNIFKSKKSRLFKLLSAAYPANLSAGAKEMVTMALEQLLAAGVVDKDGSKIWLYQPETIDNVKPSQRFIDMYNCVGRFAQFR